MHIAYLTGNLQKFIEAQSILQPWELERVDMDLVEIQGDAQDIACHKARQAFSILGRPLIVEDVSLSCDALNGLPGPYIKDFLRKLGDDGLYNLIDRCGNRRATVSCLAAYVERDIEPLLFLGTLNGQLVSPRGSTRHGKYSWNCIFQPDGMEKTMGEMTMAEHAQVSMRKIALEKLKDHLDRGRR